MGGDKSSQMRDIGRVMSMARTLSEDSTKTKVSPFDAADSLDQVAIIAELIAAVPEAPKPDMFLAAVRDVARARGMT